MPTTEITIVPVLDGNKIANSERLIANAVQEALDVIHQQSGALDVHFGMEVEKPNHFELVINWNDIRDYQDFRASSAYGLFLNKLPFRAVGPRRIICTDLQPQASVAKVLAAPVTDIGIFYFEDVPPADYVERVLSFRNLALGEESKGLIDAAVGVTHEQVEYEGVTGKAAVLLVGWESIDAHLAYRETLSFKEHAHSMRSSSKKLDGHHVKFVESAR